MPISIGDQERALEDLLYETLILASALIFRDIRYLFSDLPNLEWGFPQIAQGVIRLKSRLLLEFFGQSKSKSTDMIAGDFWQVPRETNAQARADRPTMKRLRRTLDAIHQGTVHLSWNRLNRPNPNKADRQQMEKEAEFLLSKAIEFINRAVASGLCLSPEAQALFENVNRLHQLLRGTPRTVEGAAGRPAADKRIHVEKVLSGDQRIEVVPVLKRGSKA